MFNALSSTESCHIWAAAAGTRVAGLLVFAITPPAGIPAFCLSFPRVLFLVFLLWFSQLLLSACLFGETGGGREAV